MGCTSKLTKYLCLPASWVLIASLLLVVGIAVRAPPKPAAASMDGWGIPEMMAHLHAAGLDFRVVSTREGEDTAHNAFLTTTSRGWMELNQLPKRCRDIERWHGTIYLERGRADEDWLVRTQLWGDCCLVAGPFIFFGDRSLLARIREALGERCNDEAGEPGA